MNRSLGLWAALVVLSLLDYGLTILGLWAVPGAAEMNPVARALLEHHEGAALLAKLGALGLVLFAVVHLEGSRHEATLRHIMAAGCLVLAVVNLFSLHQLRLAGVLT